MQIDKSKFVNLTAGHVEYSWLLWCAIRNTPGYDRYAQFFWNTYSKRESSYPEFYYRTDNDDVYRDLYSAYMEDL